MDDNEVKAISDEEVKEIGVDLFDVPIHDHSFDMVCETREIQLRYGISLGNLIYGYLR